MRRNLGIQTDKVMYAVEIVVDTAFLLSFSLAFLGVIFRYVLELSVFWAFPLQHYAYMFVIFLGAAIAARNRSHVRVEAFDFLLEKRPLPNTTVQFIAKLVAFAGAILWTVASFNFAVESWQAGYHDAVLKWFPLGIVKSLPFVAGVFFVLYFGIDFFKTATEAQRRLKGSEE